jgi:hypothetical protein
VGPCIIHMNPQTKMDVDDTMSSQVMQLEDMCEELDASFLKLHRSLRVKLDKLGTRKKQNLSLACNIGQCLTLFFSFFCHLGCRSLRFTNHMGLLSCLCGLVILTQTIRACWVCKEYCFKLQP